MALKDIVTGLLNPISKGISKWQDRKAQKDANKHELMMAKHNAKVARIASGDATERDYDLMVLQQSASTLIDEIMIIWVLVIVTCLFIPSLAPIAVTGFTTLSTVPVWFQTVFVGCFISKLGLRFLFSGRTLFGSKVK